MRFLKGDVRADACVPSSRNLQTLAQSIQNAVDGVAGAKVPADLLSAQAGFFTSA
ncbi:hypothetical protein [Piscinibacter gummiphilus]|uniref:Uncharacterized protein n=1 Tax=Piscinibacter gummiphilus TaxID=946333 RepID=A0ABZ0CQZ7_9BURK|nr:hypothetical protein [Piscinibacter gummiphilus]WOB07397.1 hypothetical protein RXV79_21075 [Piscinibacter gummiphilus]